MNIFSIIWSLCAVQSCQKKHVPIWPLWCQKFLPFSTSVPLFHPHTNLWWLFFFSFLSFFYTVLLFSSAKDFFFFFKGKCLTLLYNIMLKKGKKEELFWVYTGYSYHPFWVVRVVETLLVLTCSEDVTYLIDTIVQCTASRTSLGGWCEATVTKLLRAVALAEVLNVVSICV